MLVLAREEGESIFVGDSEVVVVAIVGGRVKLGIKADPGVSVDRREVREAKQRDQRKPVPAPHFVGGTVGGAFAMG